MVGTPSEQPTSEQPPLPEAAAIELLTAMRRKEGNWVTWAEACQALQKAGWNTQRIFEETGFEPIQQNQILGAVQVYNSMLAAGLSAPAQAHFSHRASDVLYELRVLSPSDRVAAAEFAFTRGMDMLDAREMAKSMKDFSRLSQQPEGFTTHPGDVMAYFAWFAAKQKNDLQARSGFIAKGLKFAHTDNARKQIEQLLTDFSAAPTKRAPRMPVYRPDSDEELPRVIAVAGQMPLTKADVRSVPFVDRQEPFGMVQFEGAAAWVPIPGWQVIRTAADPVVILMRSEELPQPLDGDQSQVVVVVDRAVRQWDGDSYFVTVGENEVIAVQWLPEEPSIELLGKVVLIMRPKKIFDESYTQEMYQWDE
jgi:Rubisco Assembly chaperone C-terminal domain/Rubisco accumulation factor 1 alpha helical domain/Rubisco accumulation factor 1 helix turn helix domain